MTYRLPTELERTFLCVVTRGYPDLERQIECCEIEDYDPTGWCDVRVVDGPPSSIRFMAEGPALLRGDPAQLFVDILLWTNEAGMLSSIEIVAYGDLVEAPYQLFVDASVAIPPRLEYRV